MDPKISIMKKNPLHEHSLETMVTEVTMAQTLHELKKKKKRFKENTRQGVSKWASLKCLSWLNMVSEEKSRDKP